MCKNTGVQPDRYKIMDIPNNMKLQIASPAVNVAFERVIT